MLLQYSEQTSPGDNNVYSQSITIVMPKCGELTFIKLVCVHMVFLAYSAY